MEFEIYLLLIFARKLRDKNWRRNILGELTLQLFVTFALTLSIWVLTGQLMITMCEYIFITSQFDVYFWFSSLILGFIFSLRKIIHLILNMGMFLKLHPFNKNRFNIQRFSTCCFKYEIFLLNQTVLGSYRLGFCTLSVLLWMIYNKGVSDTRI